MEVASNITVKANTQKNTSMVIILWGCSFQTQKKKGGTIKARDMDLEKRILDCTCINALRYGSFTLVCDPPITDLIKIKHIAAKLNAVQVYGNYGSASQFFRIFMELCDYIATRNITFTVGFKWVKENSTMFNLRCLQLVTFHKLRQKLNRI